MANKQTSPNLSTGQIFMPCPTCKQKTEHRIDDQADGRMPSGREFAVFTLSCSRCGKEVNGR
jgi:endogenous inhibitor of DNA gyrase (YacG/DUF329 family)